MQRLAAERQHKAFFRHTSSTDIMEPENMFEKNLISQSCVYIGVIYSLVIVNKGLFRSLPSFDVGHRETHRISASKAAIVSACADFQPRSEEKISLGL